MTQPIRRILELPWAERWLLMQAIVVLPLVSLALEMFGPGCCYRGLERSAPMAGNRRPAGTVARLRASRTGWLVQVAARRGLIRASCLAQSMTLWWLLRRQRIAAELRIGVRKRKGRLEAHAWAEYQGRVLNDDAGMARQYSAFDGVHAVFARRGADMP
jgi:hypothetical protein